MRKIAASLAFAYQLLTAKANLLLTGDHKYAAPPGGQNVMDGGEAFGFGLMTVGIATILTLITTFIALTCLRRRDATERAFKRRTMFWLSLGLGFTFGLDIILLLPPAFGVYIYKYSLNGVTENTSVIFSPYLVSMFILIGFFLFLITDMIARHMFIHSHTKMTHVPGINNSPSSSIRAEELAKRQPVAGNPNIVNGPTFVSPGMGGAINNQPYTNSNVIGAQATYVPQGINAMEPRPERLSTESHDVEMRRKTGPWEYSGTRKQGSLILVRELLFTFFIGISFGSAFGTESNSIAVSISIGTFLSFIILQALDASLMYYAGFTVGKIMGWLFFFDLLIFGWFAAFKAICSAGNQATAFMFAIAVGGFLYLITLDMMPAMMKERDGRLKGRYVLVFLIGTIAQFGIRAIQ